MPKVSVIIPVYNASAWIERCLESLFAQTLHELEILLVDDHGTDDSMLLARRFVHAHSAICNVSFLQTNQNAGPAMARNVGLQHATGEFVAFVDADDWIEADMYELLYLNAKQWDAEVSSAAAILDYPDGHHELMHNPRVENGRVTPRSKRYLLRHFVSNFTTMLFRRDWLLKHGMSFPLAKSGEDSSFMGQVYLMVERIAQIDDAKYHYVIHSQSISHKRGVYRGKEKQKAFKALLDFAHDKHLWSDYEWTLRWVYFKKAVISSWVDYIKSI